MTIESILISDDNTNLTTVSVAAETDQDRKAQDVIDFKMVTF